MAGLPAIRAIVCVSPPLLASPAGPNCGLVAETGAPDGKPLVPAPLRVTRLLVLPVKVGGGAPALVLAKKSGTVVIAFWPRMQLTSWAVAEPLPPLLASLRT